MKPPIAVGVVGCGYWGPNLARTFNQLPEASLVALCDKNWARLAHMRKLYGDTAAYDDCLSMLGHPGLDAVVISTPLRSHHSLAKSSLLAGKHVFVEKPIASTSRECEELVAIAKESNLILMVGHTYLFSGAFEKIAEIIQSGDIGDICYINCQRLNLGLFQQDINVAWDLAPHDLSIILQIMGELPLTVNCQGNAHIFNGAQDVINMSLTFSNNRFATIQSSWLEPNKVRQMTFVGTRKMIVFNDIEPLEKLRIYDVRVERPPYYDDLCKFQCSYHYGDCYIPRIDQCEPLVTMSKHFINCIINQQVPKSCGMKGHEIVRILEASDRSLAQCGASINMSPPNPLPKAGVASDVRLGSEVYLHEFTNLYGCTIRDQTRIGPFVEIQRGVQIGARCKISSHSFICEGVTLEDEVFIGHGVIFTNDLKPRATNSKGVPKQTGDWECRPTIVKRGASIGSGSTILAGIIIGENAMIGAGSVVTKDVDPDTTVAGNPARPTQPRQRELGESWVGASIQ